jgi:serine/threonine protein kinase
MTCHVSHGDIKPDNILVSDEGKIQVADPLGNGIGCTVLFSQNHGGTPGYWAPEIRERKPISQPGDIYSYGATLFHILTGEKPEDGQRFDLALKRFKRAPRIREMIISCCHPDPAVRPNIQETIRLLNGESWTQIEKSRQEQRQLTGVLALGLLGLLGLALAG